MPRQRTAAFRAPPSRASIDLYWVPLGAGGHSVRLNGRINEAVAAWLGADLCILARSRARWREREPFHSRRRPLILQELVGSP